MKKNYIKTHQNTKNSLFYRINKKGRTYFLIVAIYFASQFDSLQINETI